MASGTPAVLKRRLGALNRTGLLIKPLQYDQVRLELEQLTEEASLRVLNQLEVEASQVLDPVVYVKETAASAAAQPGNASFKAKRAGSATVQAGKRQRVKEEEEPRWTQPRVKAEDWQGRDFRGVKTDELSDADRLERHIGWLNRNKDISRPIQLEEVLPALDSIGYRQAIRVLKRFEEVALSAADPDDAIRDMVARSGWIWGKPDIVDEDVKVAKRVSWLNQFGMLQQPIDYSQVADMLDGLKVAHAMVLLREIEVSAHKVASPTDYIIRAIGAAGQDEVTIPAVASDSSVTSLVQDLNQSGKLWKQIDMDQVGQDLAKVGSDDAMRLLQEVEAKAQTVKDPTGFLKFKLKAKLASNGPLLNEEEGTDTKILKRIEWLNDYGNLLQDIDYNKVAVSLETLGLEQAMALLKELEEGKDNIMDPNAFIIMAIKSSLKRAASKPAALKVKQAPMEAGSGAAPGKDFQTLSRFVNFLNRDPRVKKKAKLNDLASALDALPVGRATRIIQQMQEKGLGLDDPLIYIRAAAQRTPAAATVKQEDPAAGEDGDDVSKITGRLKWLNEFAGLSKKIRVNDVVGALYCLGLAQTMEILKSLQNRAKSVQDPTWFIKAEVQRANGVPVTAPPEGSAGGKAEEEEYKDEDEELMDEEAAAGVFTEFAEPEGDEMVEVELGEEGEAADEYNVYAWDDEEEAVAAADGAEEAVADEEAELGEDGEEAPAKKRPKATAAGGVKRVVGAISGSVGRLIPMRAGLAAVKAEDEGKAPVLKIRKIPISPQEKLVQMRDYARRSRVPLSETTLKALARLPFYKSKDIIDDASLGGRWRTTLTNPDKYVMMNAEKGGGGLGVEQGIAMELAVSLGVCLNNDSLDELASLRRREAHAIIRDLANNPELAASDPLDYIETEVLKIRAQQDARPFPGA